MIGDDVLDERKAETRADWRFSSHFNSFESLENPGKMLFGDTWARIGNGDLNKVSFILPR